MHVPQHDDRVARFRTVLRDRVTPGAWQTWLARLDTEVDDGSVTLVAPSDFHLRWVVEKHGEAVEQAFHTAFGTEMDLVFMTGDTDAFEEPVAEGVSVDGASATPNPMVPAEGGRNGLPTPESAARLVRKYQFENFVVGSSNRFPFAAAMAVAEQPGSTYNPLFIYGAAGLGKTHLLNAIGHHAIELYPGLEVRYVSSETFFSDFISGIRRKQMDAFKVRYRTTDILLLDDIQFFEGKEQILEEFFHTFNTLYESGKQIVITSDRPPKNLSTLEDRLRSRFEWGLLTDVQPPDVETRLAILHRNVEMAQLSVPEDVLGFIATLVSDNIRELEGALTRVSALAKLTGETIDLAMAERVLQDLLPGHEAKAVDPPMILQATAEAYGLTVGDLVSASRKQPLAQCRQVAMYLCRDLTSLSLPRIGEVFGGRDHTTVMYAIDRVKKIMETEREVYDRVQELSSNLRKR
ncbi:MAG: chromosomal replication initiator protein DnaA [Acidimicrobiia bacterium]